MYQIFIDGFLFYNPIYNNYGLYEAVLTEEINTTGTFEFGILDTDSFIEPMKSVVKIYEDENTNPLWVGRVINIEPSLNSYKFTCEGVAGYLNDTIINVTETKKSIASYFNTLITNHNARTDSFKQLSAVDCSVSGYYTPSETGYKSTWEVLKDIADNNGLTIVSDESSIALVDSVEGRECNQVIQFASNLVDLSATYNYVDMANAIQPIGSDGLVGTYIKNDESIKEYGLIEKVLSYEVDSRSELNALAAADLETYSNPILSLTVSVVDLHHINKNLNDFRLFDVVHIVSNPHSINVKMQVNKKTTNLLDVSASGVEFGKLVETLSGQKSISYSSVQDLVNTSTSGAVDTITTATDTSTGLTYRWEITITDGSPSITLTSEGV